MRRVDAPQRDAHGATESRLRADSVSAWVRTRQDHTRDYSAPPIGYADSRQRHHIRIACTVWTGAGRGHEAAEKSGL